MKILVVDDHAMVRQGIAALLERAHSGAVVLQACDSDEGLDLAARNSDLDAVFLDLSMPGVSGMNAVTAFAALRPALPIIVLTAAEDPDLVRQAFAAGALGYVPKAATSATLLSALELVLNGELFVPGLMVQSGAEPPTPWRQDSTGSRSMPRTGTCPTSFFATEPTDEATCTAVRFRIARGSCWTSSDP